MLIWIYDTIIKYTTNHFSFFESYFLPHSSTNLYRRVFQNNQQEPELDENIKKKTQSWNDTQ